MNKPDGGDFLHLSRFRAFLGFDQVEIVILRIAPAARCCTMGAVHERAEPVPTLIDKQLPEEPPSVDVSGAHTSLQG